MEKDRKINLGEFFAENDLVRIKLFNDNLNMKPQPGGLADEKRT